MCPSGWVEHGQSCYKAFKDKSLWQDAKARCQKHGGHLVTINDAKEHIFIINMAATLHGDYVLWIGLRRDSNGSFSYWDNGEPLTFTRWMLGEPNNFFNEENCTKMLRYSGDWLDVTCEGPFAGKHPFVCEMSEFYSRVTLGLSPRAFPDVLTIEVRLPIKKKQFFFSFWSHMKLNTCDKRACSVVTLNLQQRQKFMVRVTEPRETEKM